MNETGSNGDTNDSQKNDISSSQEQQTNGVKSSPVKGKRIRGWFPRKCAVEVTLDDGYFDASFDRKIKSNKHYRQKDTSEEKSKSRTSREGKKRQ